MQVFTQKIIRFTTLGRQECAPPRQIPGYDTVFIPVAVETAGLLTQRAIELGLVQETGKLISAITEDCRESTFLFQRMCGALERENAVSIL